MNASSHVGPAARVRPRDAPADERHAAYAARRVDGALEVRDTAELPVRCEVVVWVQLVEVPDAVHVAWIEHELVRLESETRDKGERDDQEQAEPVVRRVEEEPVVAVDVCWEPPGFDG